MDPIIHADIYPPDDYHRAWVVRVWRLSPTAQRVDFERHEFATWGQVNDFLTLHLSSR